MGGKRGPGFHVRALQCSGKSVQAQAHKRLAAVSCYKQACPACDSVALSDCMRGVVCWRGRPDVTSLALLRGRTSCATSLPCLGRQLPLLLAHFLFAAGVWVQAGGAVHSSRRPPRPRLRASQRAARAGRGAQRRRCVPSPSPACMDARPAGAARSVACAQPVLCQTLAWRHLGVAGPAAPAGPLPPPAATASAYFEIGGRQETPAFLLSDLRPGHEVPGEAGL